MFVQNISPVRIAGLVRRTILSVLIGLMGGGVAVLAQQTAGAPATGDVQSGSASGAPAAAKASQSTAPAKATPPAKGKKDVYNGPTTVVVLPPTPMLDAEGKQRVDPDGKLMFNPPIKQIRDKKGHPVFDEKGAPVFETATNLGYDEKGKKIVPKKVKPPKMTPVSIAEGTLTVDGWTGKARLNYDIADLKFFYIYAPGIGTTIVSKDPFPGAKEQAQAFKDKTLSIIVEGHPIQLSSEKSMLGKKPESAWVSVDRGFLLPSKFPAFGYGATTKPPYAWPGAKEDRAAKEAPPLPSDLEPTLLLKPCPAGMMRPAGPPVLPGQKAPEQPCVPIKTAAPAASVTANEGTPVAQTH